MNNYMTVKDLPSCERPYEKLEQKGAASLSDSELLAIILKTGLKNERSTELAARLLLSFKDGLLSLHTKSINELMENRGIGRVKAIQLKAMAEISNRMYRQRHKTTLDIKSPSTVAGYYMETLRHCEKEKVILLSLNSKNQIIKEDIISVGTVNYSAIDSREVFKLALKNNAVRILLLHNHPSGNPAPSRADIELSKNILEAGELIGIKLIDHIIIGDVRYVSLKEDDLL